MPFQFGRIDSFANTPSKLAKEGTRSASAVVYENEREEEYCEHVRSPRPPFFVVGTTDGLLEKIAFPPREDSHVLIGAVVSHPQRWDLCEPEEIDEWIRAECAYFDRMWPGMVAAVILHIDEGYPHLHILVHRDGQSVKPFHPGHCAGDRARLAAMEQGVEKYWANEIGKKENRRALTQFQDHHFAEVSSRFGMERKSDSPQDRVSRQRAVERKIRRERANPIDVASAARNKETLEALLSSNPPKLSPARAPAHDVLDFIGFTKMRDYASYVQTLKSTPVKKSNNKSRQYLQTVLSHLLDEHVDVPTFVSECSRHGIGIRPYLESGVVRGISFRYGSRSYSGSQLGKRFTWANLSASLGFSERNRAHMAALNRAALNASSLDKYYEAVIEPDGVDPPAAAARPRRSFPRVAALTEVSTMGGSSFRRTPTGPIVLKEKGDRWAVLSCVEDVFAFAIVRAARRGLKRLRIIAPPDVLEEVRGKLLRLSLKLKIVLTLMAKHDLRPQIAEAATGNMAEPSLTKLAQRAVGLGTVPVSTSPTSEISPSANDDAESDVTPSPRRRRTA